MYNGIVRLLVRSKSRFSFRTGLHYGSRQIHVFVTRYHCGGAGGLGRLRIFGRTGTSSVVTCGLGRLPLRSYVVVTCHGTAINEVGRGFFGILSGNGRGIIPFRCGGNCKHNNFFIKTRIIFCEGSSRCRGCNCAGSRFNGVISLRLPNRGGGGNGIVIEASRGRCRLPI